SPRQVLPTRGNDLLNTKLANLRLGSRWLCIATPPTHAERLMAHNAPGLATWRSEAEPCPGAEPKAERRARARSARSANPLLGAVLPLPGTTHIPVLTS